MKKLVIWFQRNIPPGKALMTGSGLSALAFAGIYAGSNSQSYSSLKILAILAAFVCGCVFFSQFWNFLFYLVEDWLCRYALHEMKYRYDSYLKNLEYKTFRAIMPLTMSGVLSLPNAVYELTPPDCLGRLFPPTIEGEKERETAKEARLASDRLQILNDEKNKDSRQILMDRTYLLALMTISGGHISSKAFRWVSRKKYLERFRQGVLSTASEEQKKAFNVAWELHQRVWV